MSDGRLGDWIAQTVAFTMVVLCGIGFAAVIGITIYHAPILLPIFGGMISVFLIVVLVRLLFIAVNRAFGGRSEHPWPWE